MEQAGSVRGRSAMEVSIGVALIAILMMSLLVLPRGAALGGPTCDANTGANAPSVLDGTSGDDACIAGGNGPDILKGKGGSDLLVGGRGPDKLRGGPGNDVIKGGQGPDIFICGPGSDLVFNNRATAADVIDDSCEVVR
jgi:Ca2+-binding RTX toxin-like protein